MRITIINRWFAVQFLQNWAWTIGNLFLSIFIWEKAGSLSFLYKYFLSLFIFIPISGFIGALISDRLSIKYSFISSFLLDIGILSLASLDPDLFLGKPIIFGALNGTAIGLYAIPSNVSMLSLFSKDISSAAARLGSLSGINALLIPLIGSFWVYITGSYKGIFLLGSIALVLAILILLNMNFPKAEKSWSWIRLGKFLKYRDFRMLCFFWFLSGLKHGLMWSVFGVVLLKLIGGEITGWGVMNFAAALLGIVSGIAYSKFIAGKQDASVLILSSLLYTTLGIMLIADFSLVSFTAFFLGTRLMQTFIGSAATLLESDVLRNSGESSSTSYEYYTFLEIPLAIGRFVPVFVLFILNSELEKNIILVSIFFVVSTVPLMSTYVLQQIGSFKREMY